MSALERYTRFVTRQRWLVLGIVLAATCGVAAGITRLRANFDIEASLPANHPFVQIDRRIRKEFGGRKTVIVAIVPRTGDVWRPEVLSVVRDATLAALRLPDVIAQNVVSLASPSVRFVEESGGAIKVDYLMRDVPQTAEAIATLRARVEGDPQTKGMLVTPDQQAAILIVDFWEGPNSHELCDRVRGIADQFKDQPIDFYFAGEPIFALLDVEQSAEVAKKIPLTFLVIGLVLLISFRNVQGMFVPMLTATLSTIWGLGLMGWTGVAIDSWNVAVPILLIAIASGHSAQMLKRYAEEVARLHDNHAAVIESTVKMGPVMIAAGMTAALGFASLALFGVPSIANFGLSCGYGIASAVLLEMTFIPALRAILPAPRRMSPTDGPTQRILASLERAVLRSNGRPVLIGTAIALVLALVGSTRIHTFGSTRIYMPEDSVPRRHLEEIEKHFPGTVTMTLLYEGEPGSVKQVAVLQHMAALQADLEKNPLVLRTASVADLVKTLHKTFEPDAAVPYSVPDDQELVAQLMFLGESPAFERFTDRAQSKGLVMAYLRDDDSALVGPLVEHVKTWLAAHPAPDGTHVLVAGGAGPTILAVQEHTTYGKLLNMLVVLGAIYAVASVVLRSPSGGLYVICPVALSVVLLFGFLGWAGIRLDMGSSSLIAMAAGVGADYAIYFLYRLREERARCGSDAEALGVAMQTSGRAVIFVATSIGAGFGVMALSKFRGLNLFGMLMPLAMMMSCLAALSIMPVLVLRRRPKFVFGDAPRPAADGAAAASVARSG